LCPRNEEASILPLEVEASAMRCGGSDLQGQPVIGGVLTMNPCFYRCTTRDPNVLRLHVPLIVVRVYLLADARFAHLFPALTDKYAAMTATDLTLNQLTRKEAHER
jgi:hypothetical protein